MDVKVIRENIPNEIKALNQWVAWQGEQKDNGKITKRPVNPMTGKYARTNDPSTWSSFDAAVSSCEKYGLQGVGFVFTADDAYAGIDLDGCLDSETGVLSPEAREILDTFSSYTEISPSGEGLHVFVKGRLPGGGRKNGKVEVYDQGRFFTVTGDRFQDTPAVVHDRGSILTEFYHKHFPSGRGEKPVKTLPEDNQDVRIPQGNIKEDFIRDRKEDHGRHDDELIDRAMAARNGEDFRRLWEGDFSRYQSQSEADFALCRMLSFWTASDTQRIDRLFRQSGLYRPKWDEPHFSDGSTYGQMTIERAVASAQPSENVSAPTASGKYQCFPLTDLGNAERLAAQFGDDIRYCRALNSWLVWDGRRWFVDRTGEIQRKAKNRVSKFPSTF
jgi:putative DNA primase/helicase